MLGNRPDLETNDAVAIGLGPLRVALDHARLGTTQDGIIVVIPESDAARVVVTNARVAPAAAVVRVRENGSARDLVWTLGPHASVTWTAAER